MFLIAVPLFVMACNGTQNVNPDELAEKAVELYEEAAPVVEKAAKDAVEKGAELYEVAAPVVEKAAKDAAEKAVELYENSQE